MHTTTLSLTREQHVDLKAHLFPDDGCEAVAFALCGRRRGTDRHRLVVNDVVLVPYDTCSLRTPTRVTWSTDFLPELLDTAQRRGQGVVKIHSHPNESPFSRLDDAADRALFPSIHAWTDDGPHASAIMFPGGRMIGRTVDTRGAFQSLASINVVGDDLVFWPNEGGSRSVPEFGKRVAQSFGRGTFDRLRDLRVAVVGCSGTGGPLIEQLARNSVGRLILVDPKRVRKTNLNRIPNATMEDALAGRLKVDVAKRAVDSMGLGTVESLMPGACSTRMLFVRLQAAMSSSVAWIRSMVVTF